MVIRLGCQPPTWRASQIVSRSTGRARALPVESRPVVQRHDRDWQIYRQPGHHGRGRGDPERPQPSGAQAEREQGGQQDQRIELGRDGQAEQHPGQDSAAAGPGGHGGRGQGHRDQVPVDPGHQDERGGQCDEQRRPPAGPSGQVGGGQHADNRAQHQPGRSDVIERPVPHQFAGHGMDGPRGGLHGRTDEHWVLDWPVQVGDVAVIQAVEGVQHVDVGVAVRPQGRHRRRVIKGPGPARGLVQEGQRAARQGRDDQRRDGSGRDRQPAAGQPSQHLLALRFGLGHGTLRREEAGAVRLQLAVRAVPPSPGQREKRRPSGLADGGSRTI